MLINWSWLKKIHNLFIVYFKITTFNQERQLRSIGLFFNQFLLSFDVLEYVFVCSLNYTSAVSICIFNFFVLYALHFDLRALNSISFTCASLTVGEDGSVVALEAGIGYWLSNLIENSLLVNLCTSNKIKSEFFSIKTSIKHNNSILNLYAFSFSSSLLFSFIKWSNPDTHLYIIFGIIWIK